MGQSDDLDYPFFDTINTVLKEAHEQIDMARNAGIVELGWRLKMAIMALKCAAQIYGDKVAEMQKERTDAKV